MAITLLLLFVGVGAFVASPFIGWPLLLIAFVLSVVAVYRAYKIKGNGWARTIILIACGIFALGMTIYAVQFMLFLSGMLYHGGLTG